MFTLRTLVPAPTRRDWILIGALGALLVAASVLGYLDGSAGARDREAHASDGIGPEPRYFQGQYANGNVLEEVMGNEAFEQDLAALGDAMSRDPDAAAFGALQRQRLEDTLARGGLEARDVRIACGIRACLVQFTHGNEGRLDAWWRLFNALPPPRAGVAMSQPRALGGGRWMHRVFLSFDPGIGGIRTRAPGQGN